MAFEPDPDVVASVDELYGKKLGPIEFPEGYSAWFLERSIDRAQIEEEQMPALVRAYVDAQTDLHRLLEEICFEAAFACLSLEDYRAKARARRSGSGESARHQGRAVTRLCRAVFKTQ